MDKTTEAKIFSASVDEDAPLKPFLSEADSQKHGALNHQVWKTVKFSSKIIESREKTMSDFITQTRLSLRLESYLREYVGKHDDKPPFSTREWMRRGRELTRLGHRTP